MKAHTTPAGAPADITQEGASAASAAEVAYERAEGALRSARTQLDELRSTADRLTADLQALADAEAAAQGALLRAADAQTQLTSALADARMRLQLAAGTSAEAAAAARVAQLDADLATATERAAELQVSISAQVAERDAQQRTLQTELADAQSQIADLEAQIKVLAQIRSEAHQQLGQALADALEADALAARREVADLRLRLSVATLREQERADGVIDQLMTGQLRKWSQRAQRLEATWARDPEMPESRDSREPALRAFLDLADALADDSVTDLYHDSPFSPPTRFANTVSLHPDVLADVLRHHGIERRHRLDMVRQQASIMLSSLEGARQHATARDRASRRARILGQ